MERLVRKTIPTVRVLVLHPSGQHSVEDIPNALVRFQRLIGGYLEVIPIPTISRYPLDNCMVALVDEEGALKPNPRLNPFSPWFGFRIYGTIVVTRAEPGGEFIDLTPEDFDRLADHFTYPFHTEGTE